MKKIMRVSDALKSQYTYAFYFNIVVILVLIIVGTTTVVTIESESTVSDQKRALLGLNYLAENGLNKAIREIRSGEDSFPEEGPHRCRS